MKWDYDFEKTIDYSICPLCGASFNEGERVSVLKSNKGPFIIVHKACYEKMDQNQKDVGEVQDYEDENLLDDGATIWRYMDLAKFIMMLKQSSLYFSSPSGFSDIYEGAHGELRNKEVWDNYYLSFAKTAIITAPDNCWHKVDRDSLLRDAKRLADDISIIGSANIFINCWHLNESESEAMWKIYSKNIKNAIAIKTTIGTLKKQLGSNVKIRKINYIDYSKRFVGPDELFWFKRLSFEFEKEVRAIIFDHTKSGDLGIEVVVDLSELLKGIYISPYAPKWFKEIVEDILSKYNYNIEVQMSGMAEPPF